MTDTWVDILVDEAHEKTRGMDDYALHRALVQAGYRAGLEEAKAMLIDSYGDIDSFLFNIDAKLKGDVNG